MFTIIGANVSDADGNDPPDSMAVDFVVDFVTLDPCTAPAATTSQIQGTGDISPLAGQTVLTRGVVVGDFEGPSPPCVAYIQDPVVTGTTSRPTVCSCSTATPTRSLGWWSPSPARLPSSRANAVVGHVGDGVRQRHHRAGGRPLPADEAYFERFEGMLVHLPQELTVTEHFQLGRFGQVVVSRNAAAAHDLRCAGSRRGCAAGAEPAQPPDRGRCAEQPEPRPDRVRPRRRSLDGGEHAARRRHRYRHRRRDDLHVGGE